MKISSIQQTHTKIQHKLDELHEIQNQTHSQYKEYIEKNKTNKIFGLDSFYYQTRLFDLEMKHVKEQYSFVNNRLYCDYYKLYGMVKTFYKDNFKLEPKKRNYMPYKDLEPFKPFEFMDSMNLNQDIEDMIQKSLEIIEKKDGEVSIVQTVHRINIENFIFNHHYNNIALKTKVELYEKYLHSYHIYHMAFLSNLFDKLSLMFRQNTPDIDRLDKSLIQSETTISIGDVIQDNDSKNSVSDISLPSKEVQENPLVPKDTLVEPVKAVVEALEAPVKTPIESLVKAPEASVEAVESPEASVEAPVTAPEASVEAPVKAPEASVEAPVESLEASVESLVKAPEASVEAVESLEAVESPEAPVESLVKAPEASVEAVESLEAVETPVVPEFHEKSKKKSKKSKK